MEKKSAGLYKKNGKISGGLLSLYAFLQYLNIVVFVKFEVIHWEINFSGGKTDIFGQTFVSVCDIPFF